MSTKRKPYVDPELACAGRILDMLTLYHAAPIRRILQTVNARAPMLPYRGTEPEVDERQVVMFDEHDQQAAPVITFAHERTTEDA